MKIEEHKSEGSIYRKNSLCDHCSFHASCQFLLENHLFAFAGKKNATLLGENRAIM